MPKKSLITITCLTILFLMRSISHADNLEVRQDHYVYEMSVVQNMVTDTFVIEDAEKPESKNINKYKKITLSNPDNGNNTIHSDCRITIHFKFGSFTISPKEAQQFAEKVFRCAPDTVFNVTGYTCKIGPENYNQTLSLQRANAVASMIKDHGFLTATVQGKGSLNPVTESVSEYYKNRRVEIQPRDCGCIKKKPQYGVKNEKLHE